MPSSTTVSPSSTAVSRPGVTLDPVGADHGDGREIAVQLAQRARTTHLGLDDLELVVGQPERQPPGLQAGRDDGGGGQPRDVQHGDADALERTTDGLVAQLHDDPQLGPQLAARAARSPGCRGRRSRRRSVPRRSRCWPRRGSQGAARPPRGRARRAARAARQAVRSARDRPPPRRCRPAAAARRSAGPRRAARRRSRARATRRCLVAGRRSRTRASGCPAFVWRADARPHTGKCRQVPSEITSTCPSTTRIADDSSSA